MPAQEQLQFKTLTQLVVDKLREKILSGVIPFNERIRQDRLATEYNVSSNTIRGVLLVLKGEGLITIDSDRGAFISKVSKTQINEIFAIKLLLETELLTNSLPHVSKEKLAEAKEIISQLGITSSASNWCELTTRYYHCLYSGVQRPQTKELLKLLTSKIEPYRRIHYINHLDAEKTYTGLNNLLEQCLQKNTAKAIRQLKQHINSYRDQLCLLMS